MKRLKIKWPVKEKLTPVDLEKGSVLVATHKGDLSYKRYVKFKQLVPQFWVSMDSPLLEAYIEKIDNAFDNAQWMKGHAILMDYKLAVDQTKNNYDAWGLCFALISYEKDEQISDELNDIQVREKLDRLVALGLTADVIKENVVNFMKASPETFQDHLTLLEVQNMMIETG